jgi:ADP-ribose pyrophosphatase YjhB (NUDIX family)
VDAVEISIIVVEAPSGYVLQFRDGPKKIGATGLIGCLGGKIEKWESARQAALRELAEESNIISSDEQMSHLGSVIVESDMNHKVVTVHAEVFFTKVTDAENISLSEGKKVVLNPSEIAQRLHELTPATRAVFTKLIEPRT